MITLQKYQSTKKLAAVLGLGHSYEGQHIVKNVNEYLRNVQDDFDYGGSEEIQFKLVEKAEEIIKEAIQNKTEFKKGLYHPDNTIRRVEFVGEKKLGLGYGGGKGIIANAVRVTYWDCETAKEISQIMMQGKLVERVMKH